VRLVCVLKEYNTSLTVPWDAAAAWLSLSGVKCATHCLCDMLLRTQFAAALQAIKVKVPACTRPAC
jgi:hypothetical protein